MNRPRTSLRLFLLLSLLVCASGRTTAQTRRALEHVLIETPKPYDRVVAAIHAAGGRVKQQFQYVDGIAADIPVDQLESLRRQIGPTSMSKDETVPAPRSVDPARKRQVPGRQAKKVGQAVAGFSSPVQSIPSSALPAYAASNPGAYSLNNAGTRVDRLHARGYTGGDVIVAVLDSGIRPGFAELESDHSVIGGEDFVGDGLGFSNWDNDGHGTMIAGLISGNALFRVDGVLKSAIQSYAPDALDHGRLPVIGTAPSSKIYAIRVFGADASAGANLSVIIAAIERVIELRHNYDRGMRGPNAVNIEVCNLSFGVMTLSAGRGLLDRIVDRMLRADIVPVVSTGNTGPSSLTTASPASSFGSLSVGASSYAANERIGIDISLGESVGGFYRPFSGTQTAWFSSRGPNADGRLDPDVVASGVFNIGQGFCADGRSRRQCVNDLTLEDGTSYAAPIVSGVAAILRQAFPYASALEIRNAIASSGRASQIEDGSTILDRGRGLVDALGAFNLLDRGLVWDAFPDFERPSSDVRVNVQENTSLRVYSGMVRKTVGLLKPGQRADFLYDVPLGTAKVLVTVSNIRSSVPPDSQNLLFGDGLFVSIHSAKTSSIGALGDYLALDSDPLPRTDTAYLIEDPDTGLMRITISGDTVNAGNVSTIVSIRSIAESLPRITTRGPIRDQESILFPLRIPRGTDLVEFLLSWARDWSQYPTSDIDLILFPPHGDVDPQPGISLAGPERVSIPNPPPGDWLLQIDGFDIPAGRDNYTLRVLIDRHLAH